MNTAKFDLPIPDFFSPNLVAQFYRVSYLEIAALAQAWTQEHPIKPAIADQKRVGLLLIDVQNTFCLPEFELFVAGRNGEGAVADNIRLCQFIYRNLGQITRIIPTLDSHGAMQIFHPVFWINQEGNHPAPATMISLKEVEQGVWQVNPQLLLAAEPSQESLAEHVLHYVRQLSAEGKYPLTIWPYHSMMGGIGHALVSAVEEAIFFHSMARQSSTQFELKGDNPLTENYSVLSPEVLDTAGGRAIAKKNNPLVKQLMDFDQLIIAGQAQSHCVAWTVDNLLTEINQVDPELAQKVYLLEDCMSPVVIPGVVDFTHQAEAAMAKFAASGMKLVKSTDAIF